MTVALSPELVAEADSFLVDYDTRSIPWDLFRRLRETAPLMRTTSGMWLVARYADCQSVLKDDRFSRREAALRTSALPEGDTADQYTTRLVCLDGTSHRRLRRIVNGPFLPRRIASWAPRIDSVGRDVLAQRSEPRKMDFLAEFAYPLPIRVLCELLGVPHEDHERMGEWMSVLLEHINETASEAFTRQKTAAMVGLSEYLHDLVARRRTEAPRDDLLSAMLAAEAEGDRLSERELIGILAELLHAGFESTANMMADGLHCLLEHPGQQRLLGRESRARRAGGRRDAALRDPGAALAPPGRARGRHPAVGHDRKGRSRARPDRVGGTRPGVRRHGPMSSTSRAPTTRTWPSGWASTTASAPTWPGPRR